MVTRMITAYLLTGVSFALIDSITTGDAIIDELEVGNYSDAERYSRYLEIEKIMAEDAVSIPIFQWPGVIAYNENLKGVDPSPLSPNGLWNFWSWKY